MALHAAGVLLDADSLPSELAQSVQYESADHLHCMLRGHFPYEDVSMTAR